MAWQVLLLTMLLLQDEGTSIIIQTKDGNSINGTTDVTRFTLDSSLGKVSIALKDIVSIRNASGEMNVATSDGTVLKGKISLEFWKIKTKLGEFSIKSEDLQQLSVLGVRPPPPPAVVAAVPAKAATPPGLKPVKTLKLGVSITRAIRSSDGKKLYLLNAPDAKLLVVDLESFQVEKEIPLTAGDAAMSLSPSGNVLMIAGKRTVTSVSPSQGKVLKSFAIETEITDISALDDQTAAAASNSSTLMISIPKQAVTSKLTTGSLRLYLSKDGKRLYTGTSAILLPDKSAGREEMVLSGYGRSGAQEFVMSPDGRFGISPQGQVFRLGKSFVADMLEIAKVDPHWASVWIPSRKRMLTVNWTGFAREYDMETWEIATSWALGWRLTDLFASDNGALYYGIGVPATPASEQNRYATQPPFAGDLLQFEAPK